MLPSRASTQALFRTVAERCFDADSDAKVDAISDAKVDAISDAKVVGLYPKGVAKLGKTYSKTRFKMYMLEYQHFASLAGMKTGKLPRFLEAISHA